MNPKRTTATLVVLVALVLIPMRAVPVHASGMLGIYGIVEKVVFEPNEQLPDRIQVWGAFAYVESTGGRSMTVSNARAGYLYFRRLGPNEGGTEQSTKLTMNEWADLKSVAGTKQAVGFGAWGYIGGFGNLQPDTAAMQPPYILERGLTNRRTDLRVRPASEAPTGPTIYQTDSGIVKLSDTGSHAEIVKRLKAALR